MKCRYCGGILIPNRYVENGKRMVSGLTCNVCERQEITHDMSADEFRLIKQEFERHEEAERNK